MKLKTITAAAALAVGLSSAYAEPVTTTVSCSAAPAACAMVVASMFEKSINRNVQAAPQEKTAVGVAVKATTGISVDAIRKHGWKGGNKSVMRKLFG